MRVFGYELKKFWNWRVLLLILAMGTLTYFAFLGEVIDGYNTVSGVFGEYQKELYELYGQTLEPEELTDFNIPGRRALVEAELNAIIAGNPLFEKYGVYHFGDYQLLSFYDESWSAEEREEREADRYAMQSLLDGSGDWLDGPYMAIQHLDTLEERYSTLGILPSYAEYDSRPVVRRQAERLMEQYPNNLIRYDLCQYFSNYAVVTGIFTMVAVLVLVMPVLGIDRTRNIHHLQYASKTGRRMIRKQWTSALVSALMLGMVLIAGSYTAFLGLTDAHKYLNAPIADASSAIFTMYNIRFFQYLLILAGMTMALCFVTACAAFLLARFSDNIVSLFIKTVPAGAAMAGLAYLALYCPMSNWNVIFTTVFRGWLDVPEIWVCGSIALAGAIAAVCVIRREKRVDV